MNDQKKKLVGRKLFSPKTSQKKGKGKEEEQENEDDLITDNFDLGRKEILRLMQCYLCTPL